MSIQSRSDALAADTADPLAGVRAKFVLPPGLIYLDGNSLGALPAATPAAVADAVTRQWGHDLITSWGPTGGSREGQPSEQQVGSQGWWALPAQIGDRIGALVGAAPGQVMCGDSTSVQLFQTMVAAARLRPQRRTLVIDDANFPTDTYIAESVARLLDLRLLRVAPGEFAPDEDTAVVAYSVVDYRSGELFDTAAITAAAHDAGAIALWDLCHAAGALEIGLDDLGADLAVGCSYKYLNGGPGAPAWAYVADRHQRVIDLPITGWHGHQDPFSLAKNFSPADGIERLRIGTPPVLSMQALASALDVWTGVSVADVRQKSLALTDLVIDYADRELARFGVEVITPREHERRGSQVALRIPDALQVMQELINQGVMGDFRAPDLLRLGLTPLTLSYADVWDAMAILQQLLQP
ncbi:kynureninase [Jatrophihabitans sp. GAS493]|uniref:kynureninase n=1 Tax=Jatrophihabitans sp. GAS493 TaxID=1907575 RepID=UPI000BB680F3|nr:kynureninase [Jatrophihabitans sp. GAS493]SOD70329.1 kynureninase [Jatrophihabitans sp. GAS493]